MANLHPHPLLLQEDLFLPEHAKEMSTEIAQCTRECTDAIKRSTVEQELEIFVAEHAAELEITEMKIIQT